MNEHTPAGGLKLTHEQWQQQVTDAMRLFGWQWLHVRRTVGRGRRWVTATNIIGWPDLLAFHPAHGFAAIELKVGKDKPTDEQVAVLQSLRAAGAAVLVAYPSDWPLVEILLRGVPDPSPPDA